jgi:hypothetical protein
MAKVLEDSTNNLFVYIYSNDHRPAHVHVFVGRKRRNSLSMKIDIGTSEQRPKLITAHPDIKNKDIKNALSLIAKH